MLKHLVPICASLVIPISINRNSRMHSENMWCFMNFITDYVIATYDIFQSCLLRCNTSVFPERYFKWSSKGCGIFLNRITIVIWLTFHLWGLKAHHQSFLLYLNQGIITIYHLNRKLNSTIRCKHHLFINISLKCIPKMDVWKLLVFKLIY